MNQSQISFSDVPSKSTIPRRCLWIIVSLSYGLLPHVFFQYLLYWIWAQGPNRRHGEIIKLASSKLPAEGRNTSSLNYWITWEAVPFLVEGRSHLLFIISKRRGADESCYKLQKRGRYAATSSSVEFSKLNKTSKLVREFVGVEQTCNAK